jgi:hypothetical protein
MLSQRIQRFHKLIRAANDQSTDWLIANVKDYRANSDVTRLSLLACLRVIAGRTDKTGLPYRERMRAVKNRLFAV